jgi:hypothetical protein
VTPPLIAKGNNMKIASYPKHNTRPSKAGDRNPQKSPIVGAPVTPSKVQAPAPELGNQLLQKPPILSIDEGRPGNPPPNPAPIDKNINLLTDVIAGRPSNPPPKPEQDLSNTG